MFPRRPGFTMIELLVVVAVIAVLISLLLPAVQSTREMARRAQCANNLLQLGVALRNYESTHQVFPPGVVNPAGPIVDDPSGYHFSWIVQLLPYLEQKNVSRHIDFNTGVYSPNNLTVRSISLSQLNCPSQVHKRAAFQSSSFTFGATPLGGIADPALTDYAACHNDIEAPIDSHNAGVFFLNSHVRDDEIEDGVAWTIFLGEKRPTGDELGWASGTRATLRNTGTPINLTVLDPTNLAPFMIGFGEEGPGAETQNPPEPGSVPARVIAPPDPVGGFGSSHPNVANFLFGDGSVRILRSSTDARILRLLGNRSDGQLVGNDQF